MGELSEPRWSVMSERGCEASGLAHADAARLVRKLAGEGVSALCVVTDEAARRLPPVNAAQEVGESSRQ
ncbi:MAG TPA: hypothetical protein VGV38_21790 [Pyrinomonadaceae bacterium]|nr:hypothetical protein [Pyrinomonadaceae bacterium]